MAVNIIIDKDKCIGCGTCVSLAPKSFKIGKDGKSEAINPAKDDEATIKNAVDSCPTNAISIKE